MFAIDHSLKALEQRLSQFREALDAAGAPFDTRIARLSKDRQDKALRRVSKAREAAMVGPRLALEGVEWLAVCPRALIRCRR